MNSYNQVFNSTPQNNRNQFEIPQPKIENIVVEQTTTNAPQPSIDSDLVLKFLEVVSKDPVNEHLSSKEKFDIAVELVKAP